MLKLYIGSDKNTIRFNDAWFDNMYDRHELNVDADTEKIIKHIDNVRCIDKRRVESKYEPGIAISMRELSTGCKTAINILKCPDKKFIISECGDNAIKAILNFKDGNAVLEYFIIPREFSNNIEVIYNNKSIVVKNNRELESVLDKIFV